jgi:hypothetical protein
MANWGEMRKKSLEREMQQYSRKIAAVRSEHGNRSTVVFVDLKSAINKFEQRNVGAKNEVMVDSC